MCETWSRVCTRTRRPRRSAWRATRTTCRCLTSSRSTPATGRSWQPSGTGAAVGVEEGRESRDEARAERASRGAFRRYRSTPPGLTHDSCGRLAPPLTCRRRAASRTAMALLDVRQSTYRLLSGQMCTIVLKYPNLHLIAQVFASSFFNNVNGVEDRLPNLL